MSVELIKDLLKIEQTIGKEQTQALVEGEIICPDTKPQIDKILNLDAKSEITDVRVLDDKLLVNGEIKFDLLYRSLDEDDPINNIEASTSFSEEIELDGAHDEMLPEVNVDIEHIEYSKNEENKIEVKAVVALEGKIKLDSMIDVVKDIKGSQGLQVKRENIKYNNVVGKTTSKMLVKEAFEILDNLEDIATVLKVNAKAYERETKVVDDKVIVAGVVDLTMLYQEEEKNLRSIRKEIPFTHFIDVKGALKDMNSTVVLNIETPQIKINEDIEGKHRIVDFEGYVDVNCEVYNQEEKEIAIDTYSVNKVYNLEKQDVDLIECLGNTTNKETFRGNIKVRDDADIIKDIYNVDVKPILTDQRTIENKVLVEGVLELNMLYLEEDSNEIKTSIADMPFKSYIDVDGAQDGTDLDIKVALDSVKYSRTNSREAEVEVSLKNDIKINRVRKISLVTNMEEYDDDLDYAKKPSITVYMVQPNETIWDIAKKFRTTIDELVSTNDIISLDNIMPGEKIIIQKKIDTL